MTNFNLFVLPFSMGLIYLLIAVGISWYKWIKSLPSNDKLKLRAGLRHPSKIFSAGYEIFMEGLIHRKMWKKNPALGYMHMSFALGWFLLIVLGNLESRIYSGTHLNAPYYPIFLKFFIHDKVVMFFELNTVPGFFRFMMDFLLLFVLSGLVMAMIKRRRSKWFGMNRTTKYQTTDWVALITLWMIFPMRLLAESYTAGFNGGGGGFITQPLGNALAYITPIPTELVAYTLWWGYSMMLGIFFVTLPYSRYMHIPTEILLIFLRHNGVQPRKWYSGYSDTEVHACSRCGVCIDVCQMNVAGIHDAQAVYFIRGVRDQFIPEEIARRCLLCGRCQDACPVGINIDALRLIKRRETGGGMVGKYSYLDPAHPGFAEIVYFAGCMSHLTPGIVRSMTEIMNKAGVSWLQLDPGGSICCGRPLMLAGKDKQANELIETNKSLIRQTRARLLITSCPICYRVFKEEYNLTIRIQHHSRFLLDLVRDGKLAVRSQHRRVVYHDPCDLGRGSGQYNAPRELLAKISDLVPVSQEAEHSLCCGGSLGLFTATNGQKDLITRDALTVLTDHQPEALVTACPLCKKTFAKHASTPVLDLAEVLYEAVKKDS